MVATCTYQDQIRDVSPNTEGSEEYLETGHALMQSAEPGESWRWCCIDQTYPRS